MSKGIHEIVSKHATLDVTKVRCNCCMVRFTQHDRARTYLRWLLLLFFAMPHTKRYKQYQLGRSSMYDLSKNICPTTRRNIPWLYALFLDGGRSCPRLPRRILGARGRTALREAAGDAAVVEQLISAGATVDAADNDGRGLGRVFGSFWEWLCLGDGRGLYIGRGFSFFALGVVLAVKRSTFLLGWASWNSGIRNDQTWGNMSGRHVVTNVHWIWNWLLITLSWIPHLS